MCQRDPLNLICSSRHCYDYDFDYCHYYLHGYDHDYDNESDDDYYNYFDYSYYHCYYYSCYFDEAFSMLFLQTARHAQNPPHQSSSHSLSS